MTTRKFFSAILILTTVLITWTGPGSEKVASAQPQTPPALSSQGEYILSQPLPQAQIIPTEVGPATDDYLPEGTAVPQVEIPSTPNQEFSINSDSWIGSLPHGAQTQAGIQSMVLFDNGPLVTHPAGGYDGNNASSVQSSLGMSTLGFGSSTVTGFRMADDFTISTGRSWDIETITFFAYQTGSSTASTITDLYLQIWDGSPDDPGSSIVFGDLVTNRMIDTYWINTYRTTDSDLTNSSRPIMAVVAEVNATLPPGSYWLDWAETGTLSSGPWSPPISILGQTTTGNALQYVPSPGAWQAANDTASLTQQGLPFVIEGTQASWLWNQPISATSTSVWINQDFPDIPTYSSYLADDFVVDGGWKINSIYVPGDGFSSSTSLTNATLLTWEIYADDNGFPLGYPTSVSTPPIWSLSLSPSDTKVILSTGHNGDLTNTLLNLPSPLVLTEGRYWLVFYPTLSYTPYGQYGRHAADTKFGEVAKFINPNGGFGFGADWVDWHVISPYYDDLAFSIGGTKTHNWKSIAPIESTGRSRPAAAAVNGKIYLFGGELNGNLRANTVERYDPSLNEWSILPGAMPYPASNICAAAIGTQIYIPGGYTASSAILDTLQVFDVTTNNWTVVTTDPLPIKLHGMGCAALNNKLYVIGGNNDTGVTQSAAYEYDPSAPAGSRWSTLASRNTADVYSPAVAIDGKIAVLGGSTCPTCVEFYDPVGDAWHTATNLISPRGGGGAYAIGTSLYACGGGWNTYLNTCEVYNTTQGYSGAWKEHPAVLIEGRRTFAYASIGPVMYAIAGFNGTFLKTAERWSYGVYLPLTLR